MDPLSILSIAAAVVAFVDFGGKILGAAKTLRSGAHIQDAAVEAARLTKQVNELEEQAIMVMKIYERLESMRVREVDRQVLGVCTDAAETARSIKGLVLQLSPPQQSKLVTGVKNILISKNSSETIESRIKTLDEGLKNIAQKMQQAYTVGIWVNSQEERAESHKSRQDFSEVIRLLRCIEEQQQNNAAPPQPAGQAYTRHYEAPERLAYEDLIRQIWLDGPSDFIIKITPNVHVPARLQGRQPGSDAAIQHAILASLCFPMMEAREKAIHPPYKGTLEWVFESPDSTIIRVPDGATWLDLRPWLREDSSNNNRVYWITGKPASGKSTLMKHIIHHETLRQDLAHWAGGRPNCVASFYAWNSGTPMQKSEEALLHSILLQYLTRMPHCISRVFPRRWSFFSIFGTHPETQPPPWTEAELREACKSLRDLASDLDYRLALFVDGLDEFEDDPGYNFVLQEIEAFRISGFKICVSSRPEIEFRDYFGNQAGMILEDITATDIRLSVNSRLRKSPAFVELERGDKQGTAQILEAIVDGANGVFLWVKLVIELLTLRSQKGDSVSELKNAVDSLCQVSNSQVSGGNDLFSVYQAIWDRLDDDDKIKASRFFRIMEAARELRVHLRVDTMFVAEAADPDEAANKDPESQERQLDRRLRSRTRGLLEIGKASASFGSEGDDGDSDSTHTDTRNDQPDDNKVITYLHRTAREWLQMHEKEVYGVAPPEFDPHLCLMKAKIAFRCKDTLPWGGTYTAWWLLVSEIMGHAGRVRIFNESHPNTTECVDWLDKFKNNFHRHDSAWYQVRDPPNDPDALQFLQGQVNPIDRRYRNTFLGLAAQFAVFPYIRAKVRPGATSTIIVDTGKHVTLLENALFIPARDARIMLCGDSGEENTCNVRFKNRLDIIRLLITCGADVNAESLILCRIWFSKSNPIRGGDFLWVCVPKLAIMTGIEEFWKEVSSLFNEHIRSDATWTPARARRWETRTSTDSGGWEARASTNSGIRSWFQWLPCL
ncbi:hypothetical protein RB595_007504 [Gaeumannomyces hyphopodioides]